MDLVEWSIKTLPRVSLAAFFLIQPQSQLSTTITPSPISKNDHINFKVKPSHLVMFEIQNTLKVVAKSA